MGCRVLSSNNYRITCGFPSHQQRIRGRQHIYGCDIVTAAYTTCEITAHSVGTVKRVINYIKGHEVDRQGYGLSAEWETQEAASARTLIFRL